MPKNDAPTLPDMHIRSLLLADFRFSAVSGEVIPLITILTVNPLRDGTRSKSALLIWFSSAAVQMPSHNSLTCGRSNFAEMPNLTEIACGLASEA